jgi:hypothetical protein
MGILRFLFFFLLISASKLNAQLDTTDAVACTNEAIQTALDNALSDGKGVVRIPAGECVIDNDIDFTLDDGDTLKILGAGVDQTIIWNGSDTRIQFEQNGYGGNFVEITGITFRSDSTSADAPSVKAIELRGPENFHIHHCNFIGRWHGFITLYKVPKGLIDHCLCNNSTNPQGYYGILYSSLWQQPGAHSQGRNDSRGHGQETRQSRLRRCRDRHRQ